MAVQEKEDMEKYDCGKLLVGDAVNVGHQSWSFRMNLLPSECLP